VRYVVAQGIADLSLRPLAAALGTSARMLVYHFGSRERLLQEILEGLREQEDARIRAWLAAGRRPRTLADFLTWYWRRAASRRARPAMRLVFEIYAIALRHPTDYPGVLDSPLEYWAGLRARTGARHFREDAALETLLLAAMRGLLLDVCATGDEARTGAALKLLAHFVREGSRGRSRS
jgi:AcrR family transcriptional regulator